MMTNAQVALTTAVETMEGLLPSGTNTYTAPELAKSRKALADIYLEWLNTNSSVPARDANGRFARKAS